MKLKLIVKFIIISIHHIVFNGFSPRDEFDEYIIEQLNLLEQLSKIYGITLHGFKQYQPGDCDSNASSLIESKKQSVIINFANHCFRVIALLSAIRFLILNNSTDDWLLIVLGDSFLHHVDRSLVYIPLLYATIAISITREWFLYTERSNCYMVLTTFDYIRKHDWSQSVLQLNYTNLQTFRSFVFLVCIYGNVFGLSLSIGMVIFFMGLPLINFETVFYLFTCLFWAIPTVYLGTYLAMTILYMSCYFFLIISLFYYRFRTLVQSTIKLRSIIRKRLPFSCAKCWCCQCYNYDDLFIRRAVDVNHLTIIQTLITRQIGHLNESQKTFTSFRYFMLYYFTVITLWATSYLFLGLIESKKIDLISFSYSFIGLFTLTILSTTCFACGQFFIQISNVYDTWHGICCSSNLSIGIRLKVLELMDRLCQSNNGVLVGDMTQLSRKMLFTLLAEVASILILIKVNLRQPSKT